MPLRIWFRFAYAAQPSDMMCDPGRMYCSTSASKVLAWRSGTSTKKHFPDCLLMPPKTQWPSCHCPVDIACGNIYFRLLNNYCFSTVVNSSPSIPLACTFNVLGCMHVWHECVLFSKRRCTSHFTHNSVLAIFGNNDVIFQRPWLIAARCKIRAGLITWVAPACLPAIFSRSFIGVLLDVLLVVLVVV